MKEPYTQARVNTTLDNRVGRKLAHQCQTQSATLQETKLIPILLEHVNTTIRLFHLLLERSRSGIASSCGSKIHLEMFHGYLAYVRLSPLRFSVGHC